MQKIIIIIVSFLLASCGSDSSEDHKSVKQNRSTDFNLNNDEPKDNNQTESESESENVADGSLPYHENEDEMEPELEIDYEYCDSSDRYQFLVNHIILNKYCSELEKDEYKCLAKIKKYKKLKRFEKLQDNFNKNKINFCL